MNCTSHQHKEHIVVVEFMKRKLAFVFGEIVACLAKVYLLWGRQGRREW